MREPKPVMHLPFDFETGFLETNRAPSNQVLTNDKDTEDQLTLVLCSGNERGKLGGIFLI